MNIRYFRESHLSILKSGIADNFARYQETEPFVQELFKDQDWSLPSNLITPEIKLLPSKDAQSDLHNTMILHEALRSLSLTQASKEQLWAYLAHMDFWEYMQSRWPTQSQDSETSAQEDDPEDEDDETGSRRKKDPYTVVKNRYFFSGSKALVRHGIARLWWYGHVTYCKEREYNLTGILLKNADIALNLMERSFSRNPIIVRTYLSVLQDEGSKDDRWYKRSYYRDILKHVNNWGGVTILDALQEEDIREILLRRMDYIVNKVDGSKVSKVEPEEIEQPVTNEPKAKKGILSRLFASS